MTRQTNARLAGFLFLFYIATAFPEMVISRQAASGATVAERLANVAQHATGMRVATVLAFITFVDAVVLGVALYGITRDEDHELALLALSCRLSEGVFNAIAIVLRLALLSVATASVAAVGPDVAALQPIGALLLKAPNWNTLVGATCFALGSTIFAYLLLRGRSIPIWLAWVGVLGSALLVPGLLLQMVGVLHSPVIDLMWIPVAVFEIVLGFWLLIKGVRAPTARVA